MTHLCDAELVDWDLEGTGEGNLAGTSLLELKLPRLTTRPAQP
jgi:hypothetical protein